jgi:hypothetical protein
MPSIRRYGRISGEVAQPPLLFGQVPSHSDNAISSSFASGISKCPYPTAMGAFLNST